MKPLRYSSIAFAVLLQAALSAAPAVALDCSAQEQVFTVLYPEIQTRGGQARIRRAENTIESSCSQDWNINTVNMRYSTVMRHYFEVGFVEDSGPGQGDNPPHRLRLFTEYTIGGAVDFRINDYDTCGDLVTDDSKYLQFRISTGSGGTHWKAQVNCEDGAGFQTILTQYSTGAATGTPRGEWERFPDTNTYNTLHKKLKFRDANTLSWTDWYNVACSGDTADGVELWVLSKTSWKLRSGSGSC